MVGCTAMHVTFEVETHGCSCGLLLTIILGSDTELYDPEERCQWFTHNRTHQREQSGNREAEGNLPLSRKELPPTVTNAFNLAASSIQASNTPRG
jgi:hypothetical protein